MARAKKWLGIVAGLALPVAGVGGADGQSILPRAGHSADIVVCQQLPRGRASAALNEGLDHYSKGDYDGAADLFRQAQTSMADLLPDQQKTLAYFIDLNNRALQRRTETTELLRQAEQAEREGRGLAAVDLAQKALGNQYIAPADKKKAQDIVARVRGTQAGPAAGSVVANGKLAEAPSNSAWAISMAPSNWRKKPNAAAPWPVPANQLRKSSSKRSTTRAMTPTPC